MEKNYKHWIPGALLLGILLISGSVYGQIPSSPVNVQSPNAASLGMYGEIPVSLYTGVPNIEVPIYNFAQKGSSIPITLNYHASGFRPDMHPGWVGSGWSLASGGVISRVVNDLPDDRNVPGLEFEFGYYYTKSAFNGPGWNSYSYLQSVARSTGMYKDTEPDEFNFSFPGYSGSFYLHPDGSWKVKCDKPLKVIFDGVFVDPPFVAPYNTRMYVYGRTKQFSGFTIITEDGTKYYFGGNTNAVEYSIDFFAQAYDQWTANSWYLTKIVPLAGGLEVNLEYERDDFVNQMYIGVLNDLGTRTKNSGGIFNPQPACSSSSYRSIEASYGGKLVAPVYLKKITGIEAVVKFNRSTSTELRYAQTVYAWNRQQWQSAGSGSNGIQFLPVLDAYGFEPYPGILDRLQWKKLDQIRVEKIDGSLIRTFNFTYSSSTTQRLTLLSLTEQGRDLTNNPPYSFTYDQSVALPGYLANKTDHWGFYNGTYADISNQSTYYTTYYGYRNPVAANLYAGTLNKIVYPTKGVTEFTYEPHYYSKRLQEIRSNGIDINYNSNTLAGGLRIKKILSYDPQDPLQKKEKQYFYVSGYTNALNPDNLLSSGVLGGQFKYYFDDYSRTAFNDNGVTYSKAMFSSQSVLPGCINAKGSHIGYTEVIEKLNDNSYTRYTYSNFDNGRKDDAADAVLQLSRTAYEPCSSTEGERGQLIKEENFSGTNLKLKERVIGYTALDKANQYVPCIKANFSMVCPNASTAVEEGTSYRFYTYAYLPTSETTTTYDVNGLNGITTVKNLNYTHPENLLKEEIFTNSKGQTITTAYKYPGNMLSADPTGVYQEMYNNHIYSPVIEKTITYPGSQSEYERTDYFKPFIGAYVPRSVYAGPTITSAEPRFWYHYYDANGNLLSTAREKGITTSYIWGYNKQYPIAETSNGDLKEVYLQNFEEPELGLDFEANMFYDSSKSHSGKYSGRLTNTSTAELVSHSSKWLNISLSAPKKFTYSGWIFSDGPPGQIHLFMMKAGETGYFSYVDAVTTTVTNKWVYVKKDFVVPADVVWLKLRVDNDNIGKVWFDDLRIQPSDASMSTYTYEPLVGMTSATDDKGRTTYYEYDTFQRLKYIRDQNWDIIKSYDYNYKP